MIKTAKELVAAAKKAAAAKTLYVSGCFGAPLTEGNKNRWLTNSYPYNKRADRRAKIQAAGADTFGFDCVCLVKGLLWGWEADPNSIYGGADYAVNGVPDITEAAMLNACTEVSDSFATIWVGEFLWMPGHCGIYIGNGLAVEATPDWNDGVQVTAVGNIGSKAGYNTRTWTKHGKLPYVAYSELCEADEIEASRVEAEDKPAQEPEPAPESGIAKVALPWLKPRDGGVAVITMKRLLALHGYPCGEVGGFNYQALEALEGFQADNIITEEDGCGPKTWAALLGV